MDSSRIQVGWNREIREIREKPLRAGFLSRVWRVSRFPLPGDELQLYDPPTFLYRSFTLGARRGEDTPPYLTTLCGQA
jgi:hypothetical protein